MTDRRDLQTFHPFARLNRLLDGIPPGRSGIDHPGMAADAPILLSVGEPQNQPPAFLAEEVEAPEVQSDEAEAEALVAAE